MCRTVFANLSLRWARSLPTARDSFRDVLFRTDDVFALALSRLSVLEMRSARCVRIEACRLSLAFRDVHLVPLVGVSLGGVPSASVVIFAGLGIVSCYVLLRVRLSPKTLPWGKVIRRLVCSNSIVRCCCFFLPCGKAPGAGLPCGTASV